jgi:hypothetical protein
MREIGGTTVTILSLIAAVFLEPLLGIGSYTPPLYAVSAIGFMMTSSFAPLQGAILNIYNQFGIQGIVTVTTLIAALICMFSAAIIAKPEDRLALLINFFVGLFGFVTGVGYTKIKERPPGTVNH